MTCHKYLTLCNGYKDHENIRAALIGQQSEGTQTYDWVMEQKESVTEDAIEA